MLFKSFREECRLVGDDFPPSQKDNKADDSALSAVLGVVCALGRNFDLVVIELVSEVINGSELGKGESGCFGLLLVIEISSRGFNFALRFFFVGADIRSEEVVSGSVGGCRCFFFLRRFSGWFPSSEAVVSAAAAIVVYDCNNKIGERGTVDKEDRVILHKIY